MSRSRHAKFYGLHACEALAAARPDAVHRAFFNKRTAPRFGALTKALAKRRRPYRLVDDEELQRVAGARHHEGVCLIADPLEAPPLEALLRRPDGPTRLLFLDGVDNPHNIGVFLRTAAHFGRTALVAREEDLSPPSGATARVAEGAAEHVPLVRVEDARAALAQIEEAGFTTIATVVRGGESLFETELPERVVYLLGAERDGLSEKAIAIADRTIAIPGTGDVDSLNVATACAVLLAEHARQRG